MVRSLIFTTTSQFGVCTLPLSERFINRFFKTLMEDYLQSREDHLFPMQYYGDLSVYVATILGETEGVMDLEDSLLNDMVLCGLLHLSSFIEYVSQFKRLHWVRTNPDSGLIAFIAEN